MFRPLLFRLFIPPYWIAMENDWSQKNKFQESFALKREREREKRDASYFRRMGVIFPFASAKVKVKTYQVKHSFSLTGQGGCK